MNIEVWSDIGCPFCYIADTRLKKAIAALHAEDIFTVVMRSFELNPDVKEPESCVSHYAKPTTRPRKRSRPTSEK